MKMINFNEFKKKIQSAVSERNSRLDILNANKDLPLALFGYGNKGKQLVKQLARIKKEIYIHDLNHLALDRASANGFKTISSTKDLAGFQVVLGSGQNQIEQQKIVANNYLFYEEATYVYDLMHVQSAAKHMSDIILQELEKFYWLYSIVQEESRDILLDLLLFRSSLNVLTIR
jgi:hypothetical protein